MAEAHRVEVLAESDVAEARRAVRDATAAESLDLAFAAEMVVTELATNALLHGGGAAAVTATTIPGGVRVEVADSSRRTPIVGVSSPDNMTGRGLSLVARLASEWGVEASGTGGKVVWAEVRSGIGDEPSSLPVDDLLAAWGDDDDADLEERVVIQLGEVPTGLLVAAKRHVDNIVREFALVSGGDRSGTTAPTAAPLAELIERVVHEFEGARMSIKRQATAAARSGHPHTALTLELPRSAADSAVRYMRALDDVDAYSRANRLLTLETPPQHRLFRHWYIEEIVKQLRVEAATEPPAPVTFEDRLLAEVDAAEAARRSADRAARLAVVAVALASAETPEEVAAAVLDQGVIVLGASGGGVLVPGGGGHLQVPGTVGYDGATVEKLRQEPADAELPAAYALRTGEPVWLETIEERNERFPGLQGLEPDTVAMCAFPLVAAGLRLGALRFSFGDRRLFDDDERRFVEALSAEAAEALHRSQLLTSEREARATLERERISLEKLSAVGEAMLRGGGLDTILQLSTDAATQLAGAQFGAFFYNAVDERGDSYLLYALSGLPREAFAGFPMPRSTAIFGPTFRGEGTVRLEDVTADLRFGQSPPFHGLPAGHVPVRSYLAVPVSMTDGEVVGGLFLGHREPARFTADHERRVTGVAGQAGAAIENARSVQARVRISELLQQSLLPTALPEVPGLSLGAVYAAAGAAVGGDFYDIFPLPMDRWGIAMGDVRGRGPQAAALTGLARYTIRTAAMLGRPPADVCAVLNEAVHMNGDTEGFCSALHLTLAPDGDGWSVTYANGGHPPVAHVRPDGVELLDPTGGLVGIFSGARFGEVSFRLAQGESLVLYTDGISETRQGTEEFGDHALVRLLGATRSGGQLLAEELAGAARAFGGMAPNDDLAVFVITAA